MLRLVALAAALVLGGAALELRPASASTAESVSLEVDGGRARTARAVKKAAAKHELGGHLWLGTLRGVGGGRDTLIHVPRTLDAKRTIDVVVYMEGYGSFADAAMEHRHASSIARLAGNVVYVAPDAPSSAHGTRTAKTAYWQAGCAERACAGGHAAPGDFLVFLDEVRAHIARVTGVGREDLDLRLSLIGFSNGGKGNVAALEQLAAATFIAGGLPVTMGEVIFADGNYAETALATSWDILKARPEAPRLTILVAAGEFTQDPKARGAAGNRRRARTFWQAAAPGAAQPRADREVSAARLRLVPLRAGHHAIGDSAVDFLRLSSTEGNVARAP